MKSRETSSLVELHAQAQESLVRGRLDQAVELYEECVDRELPPGHAGAQILVNLGELYFHQGRFAEIEVAAARALTLQPDSVQAVFHLALTARARGDFKQTEKMARLVLESEPAHLGALDLLSELGATPPLPPGLAEAKLERLSAKREIKIAIHARSDSEHDSQQRLMWGDYWVKQELSQAFEDLGLIMTAEEPHVLLHLFGAPPKKAPGLSYNILWLHSHPDLVTTADLRGFDRIFCASYDFTPRLEAMGYLNVETMPACTAMRPVKARLEYDVIFLGNARGRRPGGRQIVADLGRPDYNFKVWGNLWEEILPPEYYGGRYWDYRRLEELYASARITLNDHHPDMAREGFVSNKIFDILASGGFALSDRNPGLKKFFKDAVPQYESAEQLRALISFYLENPAERGKLMALGQPMALAHTYQDRVKRMIQSFSR